MSSMGRPSMPLLMDSAGRGGRHQLSAPSAQLDGAVAIAIEALRQRC